MKISAIASGSTPGQSLTASNGRSSPEKIAAAKAAYIGESGIQVTESDTYVDPQVAKAKLDIRKIKMRTNATPGVMEQVEESAISDPVEQAPAAIEETKPLSPQFAALAKQKRALQVKEREIADREKALNDQKSTNDSGDLAARLKSDPLSVLQEHGVSYEQLTDAILANQSGNSEILELRKEIKALKEGVDKSFSDRESHQEQQVLAEMQREAEMLVKDGDTYEMVRETKSLPDAMKLIKETYKTTGEVLEVSEALQLVEDELINESLKIAQIKKVQSRLSPTPEPIQQSQSKGMRTLTNKDNATIVTSRKQRALSAALGNLKGK